MAVLTQAPAPAAAQAETPARKGIPLRLFLTCWAIYALHFSPYVVRELYLTMNLAEKASVRVDEYEDLHPDLFILPGRGAFLGNNPGLAFLAAVPYGLLLPIIDRVAPVRPPPPGKLDSPEYAEERASRVLFYRKVRERGLDIRLGVAAMVTSVFFMAPLAALGAVVVHGLLRRMAFSEEASLWLALLYSLGTPVFFRAGTLNQNLVVGLLTLFSFALLWRPPGKEPGRSLPRDFLAGLLGGYAVFTDYTGVVTLGALGFFLLLQEHGKAGFASALRRCVPFVAGAMIPIGLLAAYQWYCFGSPWYPAQHYMPRIYFRGYPSEHGFGRPQPAALWGLLFDPLYGLLVFSPMLALALYHPRLIRRGRNRVPAHVSLMVCVLSAALWIFCSSIHYTLRHQWQDGVRYMVPLVPFVFLLVADVLARIPRSLAWVVGLAAVFETWCLAMVREAPWTSISRVFLSGLELPWLTTLTRAAPQYVPALTKEVSPLPLFILLILMLWGIWRAHMVGEPRPDPSP